MSGRWFDSSRQIFWDNDQQDLTVPGSLTTQNLSSVQLQTNSGQITSLTVTTAQINTMVGTSSIVAPVSFYAQELYNTTPITTSQIGIMWTATGPPSGCRDIAMSASGQYQSATSSSGLINISSDYGVTWTSVATSQNWYEIAISASGQYQSACASTTIWISNNYGVTWTSVTSSANLRYITMSASGQYQSAAGFSTRIFISSDYGNTWTAVDSTRFWYGISMSASGQYQSACVQNGSIYISNNYGLTWTPVSGTSGRTWRSMAVSASGQYQTTLVRGGTIWISTNYGATWTATTAPSLQWEENAISASGQYQVATVYGGTIYISSDYGVTWTSVATTQNWLGIDISASGQYITASVFNGTLYRSAAPTFFQTSIGINCNSPQFALDVNGIINTSSIISNNVSSLTGQISSLTTQNLSSVQVQTSSIVSNNVSSVTGFISSFITQNLSSVQVQTSSIVSNNVSSITGFISSLITQNLSSVQLQTSSIRSNNVSSITGFISSFITQNLSSVQVQISSIVSNNVSSVTGFISSLITQNLSSVQVQTSSIVSNNVSSITGFISSLITQNLSSVQVRSNNLSSLTGQISSLNTINLSSVQVQTSSIVSNNVSSITGFISSLITQNLSSVQVQTSSIRSNNVSSVTGFISSLITQNLSSVQVQTSSIRSNNVSSMTGQISSLNTINLSSVQVQTSSIISNNVSSLTGQITTMSITNGSFSNLTTSNAFYSWQTTTTGDSFTTGIVSNFNVGSGDFTMECFFYPTATPASYGTIMTLATTAATGGHEFRINQRNGSGGLGFLYPSGASNDLTVGLPAASTLTLSTWCHLALTRSTNWAYLYSNGTAVLSTNLVSHSYNESKQLYLFRNPYVADPFGQGYINSARVVVGQALYTGNFIPPTQQLSTNTVGAYGINVVGSLTGTVAFLGGTVSTLTDAGPSALALTVGGSPRSGTAVPTTFTGRIGINCNSPQFGLDVNGATNINGNLMIGNTAYVPILANNYRAVGIGGGNSVGYMYGAFQSLADGMHLSYNYVSSNLGAGSYISPDTRGYIPNSGGGTSQISLQYGQIQFKTGTTNTAPSTLMTLTTGGLGINCNTPSKMLDVNGTATISPPFNNILINSGTQQILLANVSPLTAPYLFAQSVSTAPARIRIGGYSNATSMPISFNEDGGNIGINCNSPQYALDVNGTANVNTTLTANTVTTTGLNINTGGFAYSAVNFSNTANSNAMWMTFQKPSSTARIGWGGFNLGGTPGYNNVFLIEATTTGSVIYLNAAGGVGVGTISPTLASLQVVGTIYASGTITQNSDERVKENIISADTSICYSTMKEIDLKYFQWNSTFQSSCKIKDRHQLGFIAQDIKKVFPKSIYLGSSYGYEDFHTMESGQIQAVHYGATKKLMELVEQQGSTIHGIQQELSTLRG